MIKGKRRLIFLWPYLDWGGGQVYLIAIMKEARHDWNVTAVVPRGSSPEILRYIEEAGAKYELIDTSLVTDPGTDFRGRIGRHLERFRTEATILRFLKKYDLKESILHIDLAPWYGWFFYPRLALRRANVFVTLHNSLPPAIWWRGLVWRLRMQIVSRLPGFHIFASNKDTKESFRGWVEEEFWQQIKVTYTCVNPVEIEGSLASAPGPAEVRQRYRLTDRQFVVLCVGQFIDRKGRWVYLDAASQVAQSHPDVRFIWLTPMMPSIEDMARIKGYDLRDRFRLVLSKEVGKARHDILTFFKIADVFALPSFVEGLPIALLEAMAMGISSISTRVNAIPEAVIDHETGLLIEPGNAEQLADAIIELKDDTSLRTRLADAGRQYVLTHFDERVASRIAIDAYKECFPDAG